MRQSLLPAFEAELVAAKLGSIGSQGLQVLCRVIMCIFHDVFAFLLVFAAAASLPANLIGTPSES